MEKALKILVFSSFLTSSFCDVLSGNFSAEIVDCEILPDVVYDNLFKNESSEGRNGRIVMGSSAITNQFPYFGFLTLIRPAGSIFCGSALISQTFVISCAHCLVGVTSGQVQFGSNDKSRMTVSRNIQQYFIHSEYNKPTIKANDISLIKLSSAVPLSNAVKIIQLPTRAEIGKSFAGLVVVSSGFGYSTSGYPRYLQYTNLVGMTFSQCLAAHWVFIDSMICGKSAANTGSSICGGDSGGPLVEGNTPTLVGINAYVKTAGCVNDVQGFTRVDSFLEWISYYTRIYIKW